MMLRILAILAAYLFTGVAVAQEPAYRTDGGNEKLPWY